jgi:hypothetical protein
MNSFWKLFNVLFGETEFQSEGLAHDYGLLWVQSALQFGISSNETIENFIDKYITTDQTFFPIEIHKHKYININELVKKKSANLSISIS